MSVPDPGYRIVPFEDFEILVGRSARDNDRLSLRVAEPNDLWLHAAGHAGSHVVIRNPDRLSDLPRPVVQRAAELAAFHSKARDMKGKVPVHVCRACDVSKGRKAPPGQVQLRRYNVVKVYPKGGE